MKSTACNYIVLLVVTVFPQMTQRFTGEVLDVVPSVVVSGRCVVVVVGGGDEVEVGSGTGPASAHPPLPAKASEKWKRELQRNRERQQAVKISQGQIFRIHC